MYVCICKGITDSKLRETIADGASTLREVRNRLGVASQCGKCASVTRQILSEANQVQEDTSLYYAIA